MATGKTHLTSLSAATFVEQIEHEERRRDCRELIAIMQNVTGHAPKMWGRNMVGFDQYHYKYDSGREGDMLLTGFSPRKHDLVLYLGAGLENQPLLAELGKHKVGESCLYLKRLADVDRSVLRALVEESVAKMRKRYPRR